MNKHETFGENVGEGIGCFLILLGIALCIFAFAIIPYLPDLIKKL